MTGRNNNIYHKGLTSLIYMLILYPSKQTPQFKSINSSALIFLHSPTLTSYMTTGKTIALTRQTFVGNVSAFEYAI